jgi:rhodanese-related sulfurtransferase
MQHISPRELDARLRLPEYQTGGGPQLLDVREPWEFGICRIDGAELIPMRQIPSSLARLDRERPVVVICHHGIRSRQVALYLEQQGFKQVYNLTGGVAQWAQDVDPSMPVY